MKICQLCKQRYESEVKYCSADGSLLLQLGPDGEPLLEEQAGQGDPLLGQTIDGRYTLLDVLGRGGMGVVYRGRQLMMNRLVAVKVLKQELTRDTNLVKRFLREVQVASLLRHPHTITIHDFGRTGDGVLYFVMELLEGETLSQLLDRERRLDPRRTLRLLVQICHSLSEAHRAGVIHRDLKPENIFLTQVPGMGDYVKVLDFGIAKIAHPDTAEMEALASGSTELTHTGLVFGTPHFMSPEQIRAEPLDSRSDLYSLGVILYRMLAGVLPFQAPTAMGLLSRHLMDDPVPLRQLCPEREIPPALDALVMKLLEKQADRRFGKVEELREVAEQLLAGNSSSPTLSREIEAVSRPVGNVGGSPAGGGPTPPWHPGKEGRLLEGGETRPAEQPRLGPARPGASSPVEAAWVLDTTDEPEEAEESTGLVPFPVLATGAGGEGLAPAASPVVEEQVRGSRRIMPVLWGVAGLLGVVGAVLVVWLLNAGPAGTIEPEREAVSEQAVGVGSATGAAVPLAQPRDGGGAGGGTALVVSGPAGDGGVEGNGAGENAEQEAGVAAVPAAATHVVELLSDPPGAEVLEGDRVVGRTPFTTSRPAEDGPRSYRLQRPGYKSETVSLPPGGPFRKTVRLRRLGGAAEGSGSVQPVVDDFKNMDL